MDTRAVVVGVVILIALVAVISLSVPSEKSVEEDRYEQCVDDALDEAEDCLLSGGSDCKAKGEKALDKCKKLQ